MSDYPDFNISALLKGFYAGEPKPLTLDANGYMIAMLSALYGGNPIGLEADVNGNIQINMVAQDLEEIINRYKYGAPDTIDAASTLDPGDVTEIINLSGKGYIYSAVMYGVLGERHNQDTIYVDMDGERLSAMNMLNYETYYLWGQHNWPVQMIRYEPLTNDFTAVITPNYTFESNFKITYYHSGGATAQIGLYTMVFYSLI